MTNLKRNVHLIALFPPGARMSQEGLGRYLESLISGSKSFTSWTNEFDAHLVVAPWHKTWGTAVTLNSPVQLEVAKIRTISGLILNLWSKRLSLLSDKAIIIHSIKFTAQPSIWLLHKWSAGVGPFKSTHKLGRRLNLIFRLISRALLWVRLRLKAKKAISELVPDPTKLTLHSTTKVTSREIFDRLFRSTAESIINSVYDYSDFVFLTHNRLPIGKMNSKFATLIPDLIPLEFSEKFEDSSSRWNILQAEIAATCANSKIWIAFSNHTFDMGRKMGLLSSSKTKLIRHADLPPSSAWGDYHFQSSKGISNQWVDYWWRSGLKKINNDLFRSELFNNRLHYCIYPTQYRPHKNIDKLIESWPEVILNNPTAKLLLTADPIRNSQLAILVRGLNLSNSVFFAPHLSDSELVAWTKRAALVISVSEAEGAMPFMVSEAMSAKVPFLIANIEVSREIIPETIQRNAFIQDDKLAASIHNSLSHREEILEEQLNWFAARDRSWSHVWDDWLNVARGRSGA